jgi:dTDP-4-dehydrorhamnose reductase
MCIRDRVGINPCEVDPAAAFAVNTTAVSNLARLCADSGAILVQPSTHAVFDGEKDGFYTESDVPRPASIYSVSKLAAEHLAANISPKHYIVRFPTLFGTRRNSSPGFFDKILDGLLCGRELRIAADKIDSPTYTMDAAMRVVSLIRDRHAYGTYHIANKGKTSYYDFTVKLAELLGVKATIIPARDADFPSLAHKPLRTALDSVKLDSIRCWEEALAECVCKEVAAK